MLEVKAGSKPGLAAQPAFQKLLAGLPATGCKFAYVAPGLQKTIQDIQLSFQMSTLKQGNPAADPAALKFMQYVSNLTRQGAACTVVEETPEGWLATNHGSAGPAQIAAVGAVLPAAVLAGVAVPAFMQARAKAEAFKRSQPGAAPSASPSGVP